MMRYEILSDLCIGCFICVLIMSFQRKRRFRGKQYSNFKKPAVQLSRLAAKLTDASYETASSSHSGLEGYRIVDMNTLAEFLAATVVCNKCHGQVTSSEDEDQRMGLASKLAVTCRKCQHKEQSCTSKNINSSAMDVNRRMVLAMRLVGCGLEELKHFCCTMNMSGSFSKSSYSGHGTVLRRCGKEVDKSMTKAVDDTRHLYGANPDGTVDIRVSADETRRKRGYSSSMV